MGAGIRQILGSAYTIDFATEPKNHCRSQASPFEVGIMVSQVPALLGFSPDTLASKVVALQVSGVVGWMFAPLLVGGWVLRWLGG